MVEEVLFSITKENLETGLRGYPTGYCPTSYVHPDKGLYYSGMAVDKLTDLSLEEVIYLLLYARKPTAEERTNFLHDLKKRSQIHPDVLAHIKTFPRNGSPLKLFACALLMQKMLSTREGDNWGQNGWEDCLDIVAKAPLLAGAVMAHSAGWIGHAPQLQDGYIERFIYSMHLPFLPSHDLKEALRLFFMLHFDHGGGNLSTFVGKAVASGLEDMYGSLASAMLALEGPRHGRANQDALELLSDVQNNVGMTPSDDELKNYLRKRLSEGKLIFGFGHAVLRVEDPRASLFYGFAERHFAANQLVQLALQLRKAASDVLQETGKVSDPYANVDAISGVVLIAAGFDYPQFFPLLFGASRCVGIARQIIYERLEARGGKGTPIVRPQYLYLHDPQFSG